MPPTLRQLDLGLTHCHHPGMGSLSLPPAWLHTRTSLQLPVPDSEKGTLGSIVLGASCAVMQREECRRDAESAMDKTTRPPPTHRGKCSFASPCTTPHTALLKQGVKPTVLSLENCVPFPEMHSFGLHISKKDKRDTKQMKCIQIHNKAKNSYAAIPDPIAFIDIFSCPPHTSPWPQPAPADCPLCASDLFITLDFFSLPFTYSAPACPLLHSKVVPSLACFSRKCSNTFHRPSPSPDDCPAAWMEQKPQKRLP